MAGIVNLRQRRKAAARAADRQKADENAVRFGRTPAERALEEAKAEKARASLDAHRREPKP